MTSQEMSRSLGGRAMVSVPMLRDDIAVGAITLARRGRGRFPERRVNLLRSFAHQAVIAIENVRLFTELEARNHDLTEALDQQTATSEILKVISSSPMDVQPVFDSITESAVRLCGGVYGALVRFDGELGHLAAFYNPRPGVLDLLSRDMFPVRPGLDSSVAVALLERRVVHSPDVQAESFY